jgi:hypothetical protein
MANTPTYNYSDGTKITFELSGPRKTPIITYGTTLNDTIVAGTSFRGQTTVQVNYDIIAEDTIIPYNDNRVAYGFTPVTLSNVDSPPTTEEIKEIEYSITGKVINNDTNQPIIGAKITISTTESTTTNNDGVFILKGKTKSNQTISLNITSPNYSSQTVSPYTGDNQIKSDIGIISLQSNVKSIEEDKITSSQLSSKQIDGLSKQQKDANFFAQKRLIDTTSKLKNTLIPSILTLGAAFGVTQIPKLIEQGKTSALAVTNQISCPTQAELTNLINKKNKLVKQLNITLNVIKNTTAAIGLVGDTVTILNAAVKGIDVAMFALPSSVPPGVGLTVGAIHAVNNTKTAAQDTLNILTKRVTGLSTVLALLASVLAQAIQLLNFLDSLVQYCYPNAAQEQISTELTALTQQQAQQTSPVVTNVNGFTMGVETEVSNNTLKRRRAIAKNINGVTILTGEWSFSSIDQILIDELVFYIQQNNLKAY